MARTRQHSSVDREPCCKTEGPEQEHTHTHNHYNLFGSDDPSPLLSRTAGNDPESLLLPKFNLQ